MSFALQYNKFIESEKSVSKTLIKPRNVYRINSYKYVDGKTKSLSGIESALVFVLGISSDKKISCVKISLVKPDIFFKFLKKMFVKGLDEQKIKSAQKLEELLILSDKGGKKLFGTFLRGDSIYNKEPDPYRTYTLGGIKSVDEISFKKEILAKYYNPSFGKSDKPSGTPNKSNTP